MIPALGVDILPQNPSTGNGHFPGCSCILSVDISWFCVTFCYKGHTRPCCVLCQPRPLLRLLNRLVAVNGAPNRAKQGVVLRLLMKAPRSTLLLYTGAGERHADNAMATYLPAHTTTDPRRAALVEYHCELVDLLTACARGQVGKHTGGPKRYYIDINIQYNIIQ